MTRMPRSDARLSRTGRFVSSKPADAIVLKSPALPDASGASISAIRSTSSVSRTRVTSRSLSRSRSRSLFRSRAKATSARR